MKYMLAMLLLLSIGASAQIQLDSIIVKQRFKLNGYRVTGISNDTASSSQDSSKLITEKAAKNLASTKVQYIDTAPALAAYQAALNARLRYTDTAALLAAYRTALNARLKFTDTSAMLAAYLNALVLRVSYSDTSSMLAAYRTALLARMKYTDSSGMLSAYQTAINARLKISDTAAMLAAYQTALNARQVTLVSGTNIKTVNGSSILGSGNLSVSGVDTTRNYTWIPSVTASGLLARGVFFSPTLVAAANGDSLVAVDIKPTFTVGAFSSVKKVALKYTGNIMQSGATMPSSYGANDILLRQGTQIGANWEGGGAYYNNIQFCNIGAQMVFTSFGTYTFNNSIGQQVLTVGSDGLVSPLSHILLPYNGTTSSMVYASQSGGVGRFIPFGISGFTAIENNFSTGYIKFSTSQGGSSFVESARVFPSGRWGMNTTTDDGVNQLNVNGSAKATQYRLSGLNTAPISSSDTGTAGEIRITSGYIYICTATNTWVRSSLATF